MPIDLTQVKANINTIKRNLFFEETYTVKFYNLNTQILEIEDNWYLSKDSSSNLSNGGEEYELSIVDIDDDIDLASIVKITTSVYIGVDEYKIDQFVRPKGLTKEFKFRLTTTGDTPNA